MGTSNLFSSAAPKQTEINGRTTFAMAHGSVIVEFQGLVSISHVDQLWRGRASFSSWAHILRKWPLLTLQEVPTHPAIHLDILPAPLVGCKVESFSRFCMGSVHAIHIDMPTLPHDWTNRAYHSSRMDHYHPGHSQIGFITELSLPCPRPLL